MFLNCCHVGYRCSIRIMRRFQNPNPRDPMIEASCPIGDLLHNRIDLLC